MTALPSNVFRRVRRWRVEMHAEDPHCRYCGRPVQRPTMDHIVPRSKGGANSRANCVLSCRRCNLFKGNRTPAEMVAVLRRMIAVLTPFADAEGGDDAA